MKRRNFLKFGLTASTTGATAGLVGNGFRLENIVFGAKGPKDMVLCYPGEVTTIKMTFDKLGRYVWHYHILSPENHEMMRPFHVGPGPF